MVVSIVVIGRGNLSVNRTVWADEVDISLIGITNWSSWAGLNHKEGLIKSGDIG